MIRAIRCALFVVAACSGASEPSIVADAEASGTIEATLAKLATTFVGGDATAMTIATPSPSCITQSASGPETPTTYHYTSCNGITGDVTVSWNVSGPTFHADITASKLVAGVVSIDSWTASADVTASGTQRTMVWQSSASGSVMLRGSSRPFSRAVDATISWTVGANCVDVEGQASGSIDAFDLETHTTSFVACDGACPNAGSVLRADDVDHPGVFVRVLYGAGTATYVNERGEGSTFVPACAAP